MTVSVRPASGSRPLSACLVTNSDTDTDYRSLHWAIEAAAAGDDLLLRGTCVGQARIDKDLTVTGWRVAVSSIEVRQDGTTGTQRDDSGPPTIRSAAPGPAVTVDTSVDDLELKRLTVEGGLAVSDLD